MSLIIAGFAHDGARDLAPRDHVVPGSAPIAFSLDGLPAGLLFFSDFYSLGI